MCHYFAHGENNQSITEASSYKRLRFCSDYGEKLLKRLSSDLTTRIGRGFSRANLEQMRRFYLTWPISQPLAGILTESPMPDFLLPWSYYVRLLSLRSSEAREFYTVEALRGGWTKRQLFRQIESQFYERTLLSRNKVAMLQKGQIKKPEDAIAPEEEIKDPFVLEFLNLNDEYSEHELEAALISKLETFLLELGSDFTFVGRQRRLRVDDTWYRIDLLFYHRRLHCLIIIDLKLGALNHADAGQMHLYLNYAREHWTLEGENPPVGLILCTEKGSGVAHYALEGLPNKVLAAEYLTTLPKEKLLVSELQRTRRLFEGYVETKSSPKAKKPARKKKDS